MIQYQKNYLNNSTFVTKVKEIIKLFRFYNFLIYVIYKENYIKGRIQLNI